MSEILLIEKKLVVIENGYFKDGNPLPDLWNARKGNLYLFQDNDSYWLELRTMINAIERYGNMAKGLAGAAVHNIDELAPKAIFAIGKTGLAAAMNLSRQAVYVKNPIETPNFNKCMQELEESHYNLDAISKKIWSKKLNNYFGIRQKNDCLYMLCSNENYAACNCFRFESTERADKWFRAIGDTPIFERILSNKFMPL